MSATQKQTDKLMYRELYFHVTMVMLPLNSNYGKQVTNLKHVRLLLLKCANIYKSACL
jgi:hypothetical protein